MAPCNSEFELDVLAVYISGIVQPFAQILERWIIQPSGRHEQTHYGNPGALL
jgi:hypothetical protein